MGLVTLQQISQDAFPAYAQTHPKRVKGLVLRGIFMLRRSELLWFYQEGASWLLPDAFEAFLDGRRVHRFDRSVV